MTRTALLFIFLFVLSSPATPVEFVYNPTPEMHIRMVCDHECSERSMRTLLRLRKVLQVGLL